MEMDAVLGAGPRDRRVPWRDEVNLVPARGQSLGDRLHEAAHAVAGKARVRGRHHHDDVTRGHYGDAGGRWPTRPPRITSRHGVSSDSSSTVEETFEYPSWRSTKTIGTSPIVQPRRAASNSISVRNAYPLACAASRGSLASAPRRHA